VAWYTVLKPTVWFYLVNSVRSPVVSDLKSSDRNDWEKQKTIMSLHGIEQQSLFQRHYTKDTVTFGRLKRVTVYAIAQK
jgi:hypothetical protein